MTSPRMPDGSKKTLPRYEWRFKTSCLRTQASIIRTFGQDVGRSPRGNRWQVVGGVKPEIKFSECPVDSGGHNEHYNGQRTWQSSTSKNDPPSVALPELNQGL